MFKILVIAICTYPILIGCSKSEANKTDLSYQYSVNGCDTGTVKASSAEELCSKLKDDSANNHCAADLRYEQFKRDCSGQNWN